MRSFISVSLTILSTLPAFSQTVASQSCLENPSQAKCIRDFKPPPSDGGGGITTGKDVKDIVKELNSIKE